MRTKGRGKANQKATPVEDEEARENQQDQVGRVTNILQAKFQKGGAVDTKNSYAKAVGWTKGAGGWEMRHESEEFQLPSDCQAILDYVSGSVKGIEGTGVSHELVEGETGYFPQAAMDPKGGNVQGVFHSALLLSQGVAGLEQGDVMTLEEEMKSMRRATKTYRHQIVILGTRAYLIQ
ncbi:hypothetical protein C2845_PM05G15870 [Panicum miliaceum]|uniref:Uncharacterized protein n=1 Tax=Panicum miliaceum TaxID=4540 RepID=A0A3L6SZP4_PANMI|nr:hypothetical protein C2845_PM05G15870 [Panicum miliaceum]